MTAPVEDLPAVLGGPPAFPYGPPTWPIADPAVTAAVAAAMADGSWGRYHGPHTERLRAALAEFHRVRHAHLCASGTAAVELALRGVGVTAGDEVILAAYDFEANFKDVLALGATPVLVDVRADDFQCDADRVEAAGSERTRAVLVSHLHGGIVDMPRLRAVADARGWTVVEDACQMPGAIVHGRRAGTWGDAGVLSFGGSKLLTAGRGGAVLTDDAAVLQRLRLHVERGNDLSPLSELQAAALLPQLERLDERRAIRARNVERLRTSLAAVPGLSSFPASGGRQPPGPWNASTGAHQGADAPRSPCDPDFYKFAALYDPAALADLPRSDFAAAAQAEGVALWPGFPALHRTHGRRRFRAAGDLEHADAAAERLLVLHHPVLLGTDDEIDRVAAAIRKVASAATAIRDRGA